MIGLPAALLAALAVLALTIRPQQRLASSGTDLRVAARPAQVAAGVTITGLCLLAMPVRWVLFAAFGLLVLAAAARLVAARARAAHAQQRAEQVLLACEAIAGDLSAGLPPGRALDRAADHWPELAPAAVAVRLGSDVPQAFREVARLPGAGQLVVVGAAWHVAHRSGTALGTSLSRIAGLLREDAGLRRLVGVELAAARASARMVCALPVLVLGFAAGVGADPWHFLTATPVGLGCLACGGLLDLLGLMWLQRITDGLLP